MGANAEDRKARLAALKKAAEKKGGAAATEEAEHDESQAMRDSKKNAPTLKFRNYAVKDDRIKHETIQATRAKEEDAPSVDVERAIGRDVSEVIANVAPKRPCWDLRKEIAGKLAKLERRTQRAIAELAVEEEKRRMADGA